MNTTPFPPPQNIGVDITNRCNLQCRHCFNRCGEGEDHTLSLSQIEDLFYQISQIGTSRIRISGGEPSLHPDFLPILEATERFGLKVSVNTNGIFSEQLREKMVERSIQCYIVSLDGLRESNDWMRGVGSFDAAVDTITWLRRQGQHVVIGVHLHRYNLQDAQGLIVLSAGLGTGIKFSPLRPIGRAQLNLQESILLPQDFYRAVQTITRLRKRYPSTKIATDFDILQPARPREARTPAFKRCPAGRSLMNVSFDGYVYPCIFLATPQREFAAGHIQENSLTELWQTAPIFEQLRALPVDPVCQECFAYQRTCNGGCLAMAFAVSGKLGAHDPQCFVKLIPGTEDDPL